MELFFNVDKAEPADQDLPWNKRKRRDDADMGHTHTLCRLHQVPDLSRNQPDGNHGPPQGTADEQQSSAGATLDRQKDVGKAT